ncbi:hypothetical protein [Coraliomargarita sinensis]|nr:hypothetical protein [Coraliomargarita sinensis]
MLALILALVLTTAIASALPSIEVASGNTTLRWSSTADKQYQVYASDNLSRPLLEWEEVGPWFAGNGSELSVQEAVQSKRFFVVEERDSFAIDVAGAGYGTTGNSWTYQIIDSRENDVPFTATYNVVGTENYEGDDAIKVVASSEDHPSVDPWEQTLYILNDFSAGLYQLGGVNPESGAETNYTAGPFQITSAAKWPLLLNNFTPGVAVDADYTHSFYGAVDNTITHRISSFTLPGDSEPSTAIEVTSVFTATVSVRVVFFTYNYNVTSTTVDKYVDGVGLVSKVSDVIIEGVGGAQEVDPISVSVTLTAYSQP